ncbi:hypothetical protein M199_gp125 [Halogranum tailed virus 1]|uniref:Uncharacterized protein n=1 Tax=Halogranum tailed virus 1 TaxID=1273749 RepID=R4TGY6_9CAUD|nr:hypothetical protein M199_gp125 [Halogranum tailed virus 1]AGM11541.1 hypothetical protein HGTV1_244 [Halogranum tailed virus 1]
MSQEEYPSWRKALFGQDTVANIRCAVKYAVWHTGYLLLTLVGLLLLGVAYVVKGIGRLIPGDAIGRGAGRLADAIFRPIEIAVDKYQNSSTAKRLAEYGAMLVLGLAFLAAVGLIVWHIWMYPMVALQVAGFIVGLAVVAFVTLYVIGYIREETNAGENVSRGIQGAKERAVDTPGVRRIYGECPVAFEIEPRWFEAIDERMEKLMNE